ncbi:MAG TPA: SgcJ/EcaC family oxidoreductase [Anaerolineae bacterium]|nr:SgcJ/EcaC family oxidoreductase [Anaerolineae bacterium]
MAGQSPEEAIRNRVKQYEAAHNAGDAEAAASVYALDGTHTYALGMTHRGRAEIAEGLRQLLAGLMRGTRISIKLLQIRLLTTDVALEESSFSLSGLRDPSGAALPPVTGLCLGVYQRIDEAWFAAAVQCMVPPPPPR